MKPGRMFLLALLLLTLTRNSASSDGTACPIQDYIRLHILANSDSAWDQAAKLTVRDAVREEAARLAADCATSDEAWETLQNSTDILLSAAQDALADAGINAGVTVETGIFDFPPRLYGHTLVPAGSYRAVRLRLGSGQGKNWWCVLYPSLCLPQDADSETPVVFYSAIGRWLKKLFGRLDS